jgi:glutaminyl-peptide cyclotransferase
VLAGVNRTEMILISKRLSPIFAIVAAPACLPRSAVPDYVIVAEFTHDTGAFTQGLLFHDGVVVESTGQYGKSDIRTTDLETGEIRIRHQLAADRFGEGLTMLGGRLFHLTWKSSWAYTYRWPAIAIADSFRIDGEGWGLATDGDVLIMSNGTSQLSFLDPRSFEVVRTLEVTDTGQPVTQLNELEYVNGEILANVYQTDWIVSIDPDDGMVSSRYNLRGLQPFDASGTRVANGIAYDSAGSRLFVTGKYWPTLYEIRLMAGAPGS